MSTDPRSYTDGVLTPYAEGASHARRAMAILGAGHEDRKALASIQRGGPRRQHCDEYLAGYLAACCFTQYH